MTALEPLDSVSRNVDYSLHAGCDREGVESRDGAAHSREAQIPMGRGELVLIVDDESSFREYERVSLELYGYEVIEATNGAEGVQMFIERMAIDMVITDMIMPVMDGPCMIQTLRKIDPGVKILAISGAPQNIPANSIPPNVRLLEKPVRFETLLQAVQATLATAV